MKKVFSFPTHLLIFFWMILVGSLTACAGDILLTPEDTGLPEPVNAATPTTSGAVGVPQDPSVTPTGDTISFETLARGFRLSSSQSDPALLMVANAEGRENIATLLDPEHQSFLNDVNLESNIILAAFWGVKPSGGYSITIEKLWIDDAGLKASVILNENDPDMPKVESLTFPYHLVVVDRLALPAEGSLPYRLVSGDAVLASGELR